MTHRYLEPSWWVARLAAPAERLVSPRCTTALLAWSAWWDGEPDLRRLPRWIRPGAVALDVGANRGVWSWHMRRLGARVHAFEPNPELAARYLDPYRQVVRPGAKRHSISQYEVGIAQ